MSDVAFVTFVAGIVWALLWTFFITWLLPTEGFTKHFFIALFGWYLFDIFRFVWWLLS